MPLSRRLLAATLPLALAAPALARAQGAAVGTAARPLRVGVTSGVHAQVLERVRDALASEGPALRITEFGDFVQPNAALAAGDLDANAYQHEPFLKAQVAQRGYAFAPVGRTVLTAMAVFSRRHRRLDALPEGARVAIPNDPTNGGRALLLLANNGLLTLRPGVGDRATVADIAANPKRVRVVELEAAQIARGLDDVDAAAITGNYAVPAGLKPLADGLAVETLAEVGQYCCLVVVRAPDAAAPWARALAAGYARPDVKAWVLETFGGAVVPGA